MINIRKQLLNKINITDIILCPTGIFTHTDVKVCMFIFEKNLTGTKAIKFSKFQFDKTNQILQSIKHITTVTKNDILKERICSFYHTDYLQDELINTMHLSMPSFEWVEFVDVFELIKGELQSSKVEEDLTGDGVFINLSKTQNFITINNTILTGENVFLSIVSPIGLIQYYNGNCNYSNLLSLLKTKPEYENRINKKYIYHYLKSIQSHIEENYSKGACQQTLDVKNFNRMHIPLLPIELQNYIVNTINNLEKVIVRWEQDIENLKKEDCLTFSVYLKNEYNKLFNSAVQVIPV